MRAHLGPHLRRISSPHPAIQTRFAQNTLIDAISYFPAETQTGIPFTRGMAQAEYAVFPLCVSEDECVLSGFPETLN